MDCMWELLVLFTIFGSHDSFVTADDGKSTSHPLSSKPISNVHDYIESATESSMRRKNAAVDWKNNNILRDTNTHSLVTENVKSLLDDIMKNNAVQNNANLEPARFPVTNVTTTPSHIARAENSRDSPPRNTRDLIADSVNTSNNTHIARSNTTVEASKENFTSLNYREFDGEHRTLFVTPLPEDRVPLNRTISVTMSETNVTSITSMPPFVKNPKDKANKPKMEMNSKQFKKPSNNFKNKQNVISNNYNLSIEAIKPDNITEYVTDGPINDNFTTNNLTNIISWVDGTNNRNSSNETISSLRTLPESEGLQPLSIFLIGTGIVALISVITAIGMFSVVLYRRYHWNKPQTFSDKCSNADSTGYIDDSTLKENSEEMYSLDNDSFLNSLEAMTIQNYWADSIRHTKL